MASITMLTLLCAAAVSCEPSAETEFSRCPAGWVHNNCHCYRYMPEPATWTDAETVCFRLGGNLASVHSEKDHEFLKMLQKRSGHKNIAFWIGFTDLEQEGTWKWTDGSPANFKKWNPGEPNNDTNNEHCAHSDHENSRNWNDVRCDRSYPYICAKRLNY